MADLGSIFGLTQTKKGWALLSKAQTGKELRFTRVAMGDGSHSGTAVLMIALVNEVMSLDITVLTMLEDNKVKVGAWFTNQSVPFGFYFRELGVYALDPDTKEEVLYSYGNAGSLAGYIPPSGGPDVIEETIAQIFNIENAPNVTAILNESLMFATVKDTDELAGRVDGAATAASRGGLWCGFAGGSGNDFVLLTGRGIAELSDGLRFSFFTDRAASTPSISVDGLAAVLLKKGDKASAAGIKPGVQTIVFTQDCFFLASGAGGEYGTAGASEVPEGFTVGTEDGVVAGTMPNNGAVYMTLSANSDAYAIPAGYHNGKGKVTASITNLIANYIRHGVTVGGVEGTFTSTADATAAELLKDKAAYVKGGRVTGTMPNNGTVSKTLASNSAEYTIPAGYHSGSGKVKADITNFHASYIRQGVTIGGVEGTFTSNADAAAGDLLKDKIAYAKGSRVTGTMPNNGAVELTIFLHGEVYKIPAGYHNGAGKITFIADNAWPYNIKYGEKIAGVAGTFTSDATATEHQILSGYAAYSGGEKKTGSMPNNGYPEIWPQAWEQYLGAGYYSGVKIFAVPGGARRVSASMKAVTGTVRQATIPLSTVGSSLADASKIRAIVPGSDNTSGNRVAIYRQGGVFYAFKVTGTISAAQVTLSIQGSDILFSTGDDGVFNSITQATTVDVYVDM